MKKHLLLYLLSFSIGPCFAQSNFQPGFIVTLKGDTLYGEVDYRANRRNYQTCRFNEGGKMSEFSADELIAYGVNKDKHYVSGIVEGSFVEVLIAGQLSLYRFDGYFYLQKPGAGLHKMEAPEERFHEEGKAIVRESIKWKGIIAFLTSDCSPGREFINDLGLTERALTGMVLRYNQCSGANYVLYKESKPWTRVEVGVSASLIHSLISMRYVVPMATYIGERYHTTSPSIGLLLVASSPKVSERLAFQPEILITKSTYSDRAIQNYVNRTEYYDTHINLTTISVPVAFRYSLFERKYLLRLLAGVAWDIHIQSDARIINESVNYNTVTTRELPFVIVRQVQYGYCGGLMLSRTIGKFDAALALRYFTMNKFSPERQVSGRTHKTGLSIQLIRR